MVQKSGNHLGYIYSIYHPVYHGMFTISTGAGFLPSTAVSFDMILWLEEIPPQDWIPHDARWSKEYFEKVAGAAAKKAQRDGEGRRDDGGIIDRKLPDSNSVSHFFLQGFFWLA